MYRSRLARVEEKRNVKKAVWLMVITVVVIGAGVVWGMPLLVRLAVFIGDINASRTPIDKTDIIPPAPPQLITEYEATNSATQVVTGWTEPGATVYLTQNTDTAGSVVAKDDGSFVFGVDLNSGRNDFVAVAVDQNGNKSSPSTMASIEYSNVLPKLEIFSPGDKQIVSGSTAKVEVKGATDPGNRLTLNGRVVIVSSDGKFSTMYPLTGTDNSLTIVATDRMGNQSQKDLSVTYMP